MSSDFVLHVLLLVGTGALWTLTYGLIIVQSRRDRWCGMPFAALCANVSWEFLFAFVLPQSLHHTLVSFIWFALDLIILWQYVKYDPSPGTAKLVNLAASILLAVSLIYGFASEFHDDAGRYSGFGLNLMMSLLFIRMLRENGPKGQSPAIAWSKLAGTLCASLLFHSLYPDSLLLNLLYVLILILDAAYLVMIHAARRTDSL